MRPVLASAVVTCALLLGACGPADTPPSRACLEAQVALGNASAGLSDFAAWHTPEASARVLAADALMRERCQVNASAPPR